MITLDNAVKFLSELDKLRPLKSFSSRVKSRGLSLRTLILFYTILKNEGETQDFYATLLDWTIQNVNLHTNTLESGGFIYFGEGIAKYHTRPARTLFVTKEARKLMLELLKGGGNV